MIEMKKVIDSSTNGFHIAGKVGAAKFSCGYSNHSSK